MGRSTTWAAALLVCSVVGCDATKSKEYVALDAKNAELESQVKKLTADKAALQADLDKWKADPQANYKRIQESLDAARTSTSFADVAATVDQFVRSYPKSNLVPDARALANEAKRRADIAVAEEQREAERQQRQHDEAEKERQEKAAHIAELFGTAITFDDFYRMSREGMSWGKRFNFQACLVMGGSTAEIGRSIGSVGCTEPTVTVEQSLDNAALALLGTTHRTPQMQLVIVSNEFGRISLKKYWDGPPPSPDS